MLPPYLGTWLKHQSKTQQRIPKCNCGFSRQVEHTTGPYFRRRLWSNHEGACQGDSKEPLGNPVHWRGRVKYHCWNKPGVSEKRHRSKLNNLNSKIHFAKCRPLLEVTCISSVISLECSLIRYLSPDFKVRSTSHGTQKNTYYFTKELFFSFCFDRHTQGFHLQSIKLEPPGTVKNTTCKYCSVALFQWLH